MSLLRATSGYAPHGPALKSGAAIFSQDGSYRYLLTRSFGRGEGSCLFVMLNPSTADAERDDPTIRRCSGFATAWGFAELRVVNLFALRSTDPRSLEAAADPIGPDNDCVLRQELAASEFVVAAWGNKGALRRRSSSVRAMIAGLKISATCLGHNGGGEPAHPLYVAAATRPVPL